MVEHLEKLLEFALQFTTSDLVNLFAIVEGLATVVAAIGAIIAVVITKKIAKEQISLAEKQNTISDKQNEISEKQNKIALFEKRYAVYRNINKIRQLADFLSAGEETHSDLSVERIINLWVSIQRSEFCLQETLHFAPKSLSEQEQYDSTPYTYNKKLEDLEIMRKQSFNDRLLLEEGILFFSEPIKSKLQELSKTYGLFMIDILIQYSGEKYPIILDNDILRKQLISQCKEFSPETALAKSLFREMSII